jgi:hypothetical protein
MILISLTILLAQLVAIKSFHPQQTTIRPQIMKSRLFMEKISVIQQTPVSSPELGSVHGLWSESNAECQCYTNCPLLTDNPMIQKRLARITQPRPYPLFLAEKAAKYLIDDIWNPPKHDNHQIRSHSITPTDSKKEKVVILGAGWGSASFLKGIDTQRYDVTIISPRNYFLYTPMLAGSAVGTVDIRSITQPIREVSLSV